jgi:very-short-patch-repair endonuclease
VVAIAAKNEQRAGGAAWRLARSQHGVISATQLKALGYSRSAIRHRVAKRRLHPIHRGVYAVGRRDLTQEGKWMAAVLVSGPGALLSHQSAAALLEIRPPRTTTPIHISLTANVNRAHPGITTHRRSTAPQAGVCRSIPVTSPLQTLVDLAPSLRPDELETALNEAVKLDLVDPETLRGELSSLPRQRGLAPIRRLLERQEFTLSDSELERRFLRLVRTVGLPPPLTQQRVNGFRVDFHWPDLGLVVETDGLRFHRTATDQARDRRRDQAHAAAGLTALRFTHAQVYHEPGDVAATLVAIACRLAPGQPAKRKSSVA